MARGRWPVTRLRGWLAPLGRAALGAMLLAVLLPATLAAAREVVLPVPRVTIYPGEVITEAMLVDMAFRGRDYEAPGIAATREALVGKVARSTLLPRTPISAGGVREPFAVQQGQPAVVIFQAGGLIISGVAVPLQAGSAGDLISLRNTESGTTIRGRVHPDGTVRVGVP
ncbi:flagellar basal body P-ring formation chaperone FlgA [Hyphomicrobium sp.]|uniref:flagellar basal body P-ring formation chaperone FlgA n=1 Tax=Hyphomicrobium sp. TaxID=82 RepID=UPI0025C5CE19|nr:flagellar basal body P-ring formation chaperone FlgA [Hyphomicrobium sp.]MCC7253282.1 flagellar basal body P-ring formation protein FlgA [Hyphomicrobium sp.]